MKDKKKQVEVVRHRFEKEAHDFDGIYRQDQGFFQTWFNRHFRKPIFERYEVAFQEMGQLKGNTLLDIGCGSGIYVVSFVRSGGQRALGIDFSSEMLNIAAQRAMEQGVADTCKFEHTNFLETKLVEKYDFVIAMGVFDYLSDPATFLRKMQSVAKRKVIISLPGHSLVRETLRKLRYWFGSKGDVYFYSEADIRCMAAEAGIMRFEIRPLTTGSGYIFIGEA
jgi:ubiquinone/menaquinone biosynthesis C-methylase UbiE